MTKIYSKSKMLARLEKEGRSDQISPQALQIMTALDGREAQPNRWRQTVYGEENAWFCTTANGEQYPVNPEDCEDIHD